MTAIKCALVICIALALNTAYAAGSEADGPSFSCARAHSEVEQIICSDSELARLDRTLADTYTNLTGQPSTDPVALRKEEDLWLQSERNHCKDRNCLAIAYQHRIDVLRQRSLKLASPAAFEETRPFPLTASTMQNASKVIGKTCKLRMDLQEPVIPGFSVDPSMRLPVLFAHGAVVVRKHDKERVAFLLKMNDAGECQFADFAALPNTEQAASFLSCSIFDLNSVGVGVRIKGKRELAGYWEINGSGKLQRQALGVMGANQQVRCTEPETGE